MQGGKTTVMLKMIQNAKTCFKKSYDAYVFCSPHMDETTASYKDRQFRQTLIDAAHPTPVEFFNHVVTLKELQEFHETLYLSQDGPRQDEDARILIFLDDLDATFNDPMAASFFCKLSSHHNYDCVVSVHQGIGNTGKNFRLILQNTNCFIVMRNMSDKLAISQLSSRIFPKCDNILSKTLNTLTKILGPYAFLTIDCSNSSKLNEMFPIKANIFLEDGNPMFLVENPLNVR